MEKITKEEFIERDMTAFNYSTIEEYNEKWSVIPCDCNYEHCQGWISVPVHLGDYYRRGLNG